VVFQGEDLKKISVKQYAQQVAVIPQRMELPFNLSVEEFVTLGRFAHLGRFDPLRQNDREIVRQTLELTELIDLKDQDINEISGGELQRVILAQGFAQRPQVLILDEPTTHLDITHQIRILNLLKKMNRESNLTIIMSIHDLNLASEYCDSLILLSQGRIFKEGDPHAVVTYKNIEEVYKTLVVVKENPISGKPYVVLVSNR
jgi:iron complex transport system ATP-binding protein